MPILKRKPQQEEKSPTPGTSKNPMKGPARDAFAEKMAATDATEGGVYVPPPPGNYSALVTEAQGVVDGDKTCAYFECTIVDNEDLAGKTCRIYFNFTDENGDEATGMPFFKSALVMFGIDPDKEITSWDSMCEILAQIAEAQMWCHINVKKKSKWTNIYLDDVPEDQDSKPKLEE